MVDAKQLRLKIRSLPEISHAGSNPALVTPVKATDHVVRGFSLGLPKGSIKPSQTRLINRGESARKFHVKTPLR